MSFDDNEFDEVIIEKDSDPSRAINLIEVDNPIPENIYWESVLASIECCSSSVELSKLVTQLQKEISPVRQHNMDVLFNPAVHSTSKKKPGQHGRPRNDSKMQCKQFYFTISRCCSFMFIVQKNMFINRWMVDAAHFTRWYMQYRSPDARFYPKSIHSKCCPNN